FLVTQYFQFVRGYGTLSTGARILPVALSIAVASVAGAQLAPRIGTRAVVTTGLVLFGTSFLWISTVGLDASYATVIVPQMVLMGLGMGLIQTPATESILLVLPPARAGVGSAVNDATRELGGTLGVAVVGSLFSSVYAGHLADGAFADLPGHVLTQAQDSVGAALHVVAVEPRLGTALQDAFMAGFSTASAVVGVVCLLGALGAVLFLPGREVQAPAEDASPEASPALVA
ncbi:MAG: MFS transporter, partial [Marmoricola sp.]|nr:MFS transporter [Marmoricola sp.]